MHTDAFHISLALIDYLAPLVMLDVIQAWGHVLPEHLAQARDTARRLSALTAPA